MIATFIFNDETKKNSHNFYLVNSGGRLERFNNNPVMLDNHNIDRLIGKWQNLRIEGNLLIADPVFDDGTEIGKERKGQVERGFLKGASPGIIPLSAEYRENPITGEVEMYVTEWELVEGSTTPVPSNAGALTLRIYSGDQQPVADKDVNLHMQNIIKLSAESKAPGIISNIKQMEKITLTAEACVALGIKDGADTTAISAAIVKLHSDYKTATGRVETLENEAKEVKKKTAVDMVDLAIKEGKVTADKKEAFISLAINDYDLAKSTLDAIPAKVSLSAAITVAKIENGIPAGREGWTHLKWLREDPNGLAKIKTEQPETFEAIKAIR